MHRHRPRTPSRLPPPVSPLLMCLGVPRQDALAFNQPLSFDTSSVTSMEQMFNVRTPPRARAVPGAQSVPPCTRCVHRHRPNTPSRLPPARVALLMCLGVPRQYASAFNQPLSLDTSSVTGMAWMFSVRSPLARAVPGVQSAIPCTLRAPPPPPQALAPPTHL